MVHVFSEGKTMLRLIPNRRRRVSNGLAVFGALLLAASLLAGSGQPQQSAEQQADAAAVPAVLQTGGVGDASQPANRNTRKFRVNLFLFRH
jgi:hypothetical protein